MHRWWRQPLSLLVIVAGAFVATGVVLVPVAVVMVVLGLRTGPAGLPSNPLVFLGVALAGLALLIPVVMLAAWLVERRPVGSLSSVVGRLRLGWLLQCAAVAVVAQIAGMVALYVAFVLAFPGARSAEAQMFGWAGWGTFLPAALLIIVLVPFQATGEEFVFRGWLLQAFGAYLRTPWPGIVVSALAFAGLHGYGRWGFADIAVFALVAGWLAVRTGGLEVTIALHTLHNLGALLPAAAADNLDEALRATDVPWPVLAGTVAELAVFAGLVLVLARRRGLSRRSGGT